MPEKNDHIIGATNELCNLFIQQKEIFDSLLAADKLDSKTVEQLKEIDKEYSFLNNYINQNIKIEDSQRFIGKMLMDAKRQADDIVQKAQTSANQLAADADKELKLIVSQQSQPNTRKLNLDTTIQFGEIDDSENRYEQVNSIHRKYKDSLDNILKEIDLFLER